MKKIMFLLIGLIFIVGCQPEEEVVYIPLGEIEDTTTGGKTYEQKEPITEQCDNELFYYKNDIILVNDNVDRGAVWSMCRENAKPVFFIEGICIENLTQPQKDCLVGYSGSLDEDLNCEGMQFYDSDKYGYDIRFLEGEFYHTSFIDVYPDSRRIDCEEQCRTIRTEKDLGLKEGFHTYEYERHKYNITINEVCWKYNIEGMVIQ